MSMSWRSRCGRWARSCGSDDGRRSRTPGASRHMQRTTTPRWRHVPRCSLTSAPSPRRHRSLRRCRQRCCRATAASARAQQDCVSERDAHLHLGDGGHNQHACFSRSTARSGCAGALEHERPRRRHGGTATDVWCLYGAPAAIGGGLPLLGGGGMVARATPAAQDGRDLNCIAAAATTINVGAAQ